jgi:hypothetical protein
VEVCLWLETDGESKVARGGDPHDGHHPPLVMVNILVGLLSCSLIRLLLPRSQAKRSTFTKHRDYPTIGASLVRDRGPKGAVFNMPAGNSVGNEKRRVRPYDLTR